MCENTYLLVCCQGTRDILGEYSGLQAKFIIIN